MKTPCFVGFGKTMAAAALAARFAGRRGLLVATVFATLAMATGCARVAPYQRGALAHPTMSSEEIASAIDEHVRAVSEGATGGLGAGGGGCGCN